MSTASVSLGCVLLDSSWAIFSTPLGYISTRTMLVTLLYYSRSSGGGVIVGYLECKASRTCVLGLSSVIVYLRIPPSSQGCRLLISTMLAYAGMCWSAPPACTPILTVLIWYFKCWFDKPSVRHVRHIRHTFHQSTTNIPRTNQSCCQTWMFLRIHKKTRTTLQQESTFAKTSSLCHQWSSRTLWFPGVLSISSNYIIAFSVIPAPACYYIEQVSNI